MDNPDLVSQFSTNGYNVIGTGFANRQHAVRVGTVEDRFLQLENHFFCEKPTEKTVELNFKDKQGAAHTVTTPKITCQYPIMEIFDLSLQHASNIPNHPVFQVNRLIIFSMKMRFSISSFFRRSLSKCLPWLNWLYLVLSESLTKRKFGSL